MHLRNVILATAAAATLVAGQVAAQPRWVPPGNDPNGYYSDSDQNGYYDRDGRYRRIRGMGPGRYDRDYGPPPPPAPPPGAYYQQGRYEADCRSGNATAGTIFGAIAGGLIGGAASRGNGGAVAGGVVVGGLLGNVIGRDVDCEDQPTAYRVYGQSLNGDVGRPYEWSSRGNHGTFTSVREYRRGGMICRDFTTITYRRGEQFSRNGTACRDLGTGNWRFD